MTPQYCLKLIAAIILYVTAAQPHADELSAQAPKIAIIIDDIGYNLPQGRIAARFPAPLTLAVLPHAPNSHSLAKLGHLHGKEIMLHAPMSTINPHPLDQGGLRESMDHGTFIATLRDNIAAIPYITGLNNHMGSALTQHQQSMNWLMQELQYQGLFFVDSRTTASSVALNTAQDYDIPSRSRDVFLDHDRTTEAVDRQFQKLLQVARKKGSAIAIGHPAPVTMDYLSSQLAQLDSLGVQLVNVSELIPQAPPKPSAIADLIPTTDTTETVEAIKEQALPKGYFPEDRVTIY